MTVNEYVRQWCDEDYDLNKEDFYMANAYYVADREKAIGGFKHGLIAMAIAIIVAIFGDKIGMSNCFMNSLLILGASTICYWFYAAQEYDANNDETSRIDAIMIALFLLWTNVYVGNFVRILFICASMALFIYMTIIAPLRFVSVAKSMHERMKAAEEEEEQREKAAYEQWKRGGSTSQNGMPEPDPVCTETDPVMAEARAMFNGYTADAQMLKTRYRQLAKQHHPDRGGDTRMFQCIAEVYDELKNSMAA